MSCERWRRVNDGCSRIERGGGKEGWAGWREESEREEAGKRMNCAGEWRIVGTVAGGGEAEGQGRRKSKRSRRKEKGSSRGDTAVLPEAELRRRASAVRWSSAPASCHVSARHDHVRAQRPSQHFAHFQTDSLICAGYHRHLSFQASGRCGFDPFQAAVLSCSDAGKEASFSSARRSEKEECDKRAEQVAMCSSSATLRNHFPRRTLCS